MNLNRYIIGGIAMFTASVCAASPYQLSTHILDINKGKPAAESKLNFTNLITKTGTGNKLRKKLPMQTGELQHFYRLEKV